MRLPKFLAHLFPHATACGLRRTSSPSPLRMIRVAFEHVKTLGIRNNLYFEAVPALQGTRFPLRPTGFSVYASPVLFADYFIDSASGARLDTGGWLVLTRQGLSPYKMRQALLGATTSQGASGGASAETAVAAGWMSCFKAQIV